MSTAQEVFKEWVKSALAPALRDMGFKGSGLSYWLPDVECWVLLGIQKSTASTSEQVKFTLNLSVANKHYWDELREWEHYWLPARPSANAVSPGQVVRRIGTLMPAGQDLWWAVGAEASPEELDALRQAVDTAVRNYGLPGLAQLREQSTAERLRDRLEAIRRVRPRPSHLKEGRKFGL